MIDNCRQFVALGAKFAKRLVQVHLSILHCPVEPQRTEISARAPDTILTDPAESVDKQEVQLRWRFRRESLLGWLLVAEALRNGLAAVFGILGRQPATRLVRAAAAAILS